MSAATSTTLDGNTFDTLTIPPLPEENSDNCLAATKDGIVFSIGGSANLGKSVYKFRPGGGNQWEEMPPTNFVRQGSGCGIVTNSSTGQTFLLVAGGAQSETTVEILELNVEGVIEWQTGLKQEGNGLLERR